MLRRTLPVRFVTLTLVVWASSANAQIIDVTPELFARIRGWAETARKAHPTSPDAAVDTFTATFNGEMGNIFSSASMVAMRDDISIMWFTPLDITRSMMMQALQSLDPLPDKTLHNDVSLNIRPRQRGAPNVKRVVLFRDGTEIAPVLNMLEPTEFVTGAGVKFMVTSGAVLFPRAAFAPGGEIKLVIITDGKPIEWSDKGTLK